jgi:hypothetical protein
MEIKIINYKKEYQVINNSEIVLEARKPKWYSSEVNFQHNDKNYEIKKIKFWSMSYTIFELERPIGEIDLSYMKGGVIRLKNKNATYNEYTLKKEKVGKWYTSERRYVLKKKDLSSVLIIHYGIKNRWSLPENISASFNDKLATDFVLLVCSLFLMRQQLSSENNVSIAM